MLKLSNVALWAGLAVMAGITTQAAEDKMPYYTGTVSPEVQKMADKVIIPINAQLISFDLGVNPVKSAPYAQKMLQERFVDLNNANGKPTEIKLIDLNDPAAEKFKGDFEAASGVAEGYIIKIVPGADKNIIYCIGNDNRGVFYAAMTLLQMTDRVNELITIGDTVDYPVWPIRYMTDYYLGKQDESLLYYFGLFKMNGYGVQQAVSWREMAPEAKMQYGGMTTGEMLKHFADFYDRTGGIFDLMMAPRVYGYGDKVKFDISNEDNIKDLIEYCRFAAQHRVKHIMIRVDDVVPQKEGKYHFLHEGEEAKFKSVGQAHGYLMKRLYEALNPEFPELELSFCPGPYTITSHLALEEPSKGYLEDMAAELPEAVWVVWTGRDVCTPKIEKEPTEQYLKLINNHRLYTWHNPDFIVNSITCPDNLDFYDGYLEQTDGFFFANNAGVGKERNRPGELLYNEYLWSPAKYNGWSQYIDNAKKLFNIPDKSDYSNWMLEIRSLPEIRDRKERAAKLLEIKEKVPFYENYVDLRWLKAYIEREYANATAELPQISVPNGPLEIVVDGKLNEEVWDHAATLTFTDKEGKDISAEFATTGRVYYDKERDTLYFAFVGNRSGELQAEEKRGKDSKIREKDSIMMHFLPTGERVCYMGFDSSGNKFDNYHWVLDWNPEWPLAIERGDGFWVAEMAIPVDAFREATLPPEDKIIPGETEWKFQAIRYNADDSKDKQYFSYPNAEESDDINRYGKLLF